MMTPRRDWLDRIYRLSDWLADADHPSADGGRWERLGAVALVALLALCVGGIVLGLIFGWV